MLNYLWAGMMMLGIIYAAFTGRMPDITNAALDSSKEAITLCITMIGIMSFWVGLMEIATKAGIIEQLSRKLKPLIHFLFPNLPDNHPAATHITTNIIANILGTWLGCDTCRTKRNGRTEKSGRRPPQIPLREKCALPEPPAMKWHISYH